MPLPPAWLRQVDHFLREQTHVHHAAQPPLVIDDREGEKSVKEKELARFLDRGRCRDRLNAAIHQFRQRSVERRREQCWRRYHADEPALVIDDVKINDFFADALPANIGDLPFDRPVLANSPKSVRRWAETGSFKGAARPPVSDCLGASWKVASTSNLLLRSLDVNNSCHRHEQGMFHEAPSSLDWNRTAAVGWHARLGWLWQCGEQSSGGSGQKEPPKKEPEMPPDAGPKKTPPDMTEKKLKDLKLDLPKGWEAEYKEGLVEWRVSKERPPTTR